MPSWLLPQMLMCFNILLYTIFRCEYDYSYFFSLVKISTPFFVLFYNFFFPVPNIKPFTITLFLCLTFFYSINGKVLCFESIGFLFVTFHPDKFIVLFGIIWCERVCSTSYFSSSFWIFFVLLFFSYLNYINFAFSLLFYRSCLFLGVGSFFIFLLYSN